MQKASSVAATRPRTWRGFMVGSREVGGATSSASRPRSTVELRGRAQERRVLRHGDLDVLDLILAAERRLEAMRGDHGRQDARVHPIALVLVLTALAHVELRLRDHAGATIFDPDRHAPPIAVS